MNPDIRREIDKLNQSHSHRGYTIEIKDSCISTFCHDHYDIIRGARGLSGYIKINVRPFIVNHILQNPQDQGVFKAIYNQQTHSFDMEILQKLKEDKIELVFCNLY
ncbi:hypothetical protein [Gilliamella bombi]|uniref:hypothetical protein n=1 Tax=Gilliamella bombi TaxID=1908521 RepID=UPI000A15FD1D|nr:hypothetical protein [Gilliamella bombi]